VTPVEALQRIVHCLDRAHVGGFKTKAWVRALDVVQTTDPAELEERARNGTLTELPGIGDSTARVIREAIEGKVPGYLTKLEAETVIQMSPEAAAYRAALRGDCHTHSTWSDGGASIEDMAGTAIALGHEYMVLTDHSARLTIAHGLDRERLLAQLDELAVMNERLAPFRILTGMEVDILEDGQLDLADDLLARLDVVVASVHSKLRMERPLMTQRMVLAAASPHVDILGHCTGRLIGKRPESVCSTPTTCSRPAPSTGPRSRSTAGPSDWTRRRSCSTSPSPTAASSRSTPTPTPPASSSGSPTGARRRR
jgi:putative hydrolase